MESTESNQIKYGDSKTSRSRSRSRRDAKTYDPSSEKPSRSRSLSRNASRSRSLSRNNSRSRSLSRDNSRSCSSSRDTSSKSLQYARARSRRPPITKSKFSSGSSVSSLPTASRSTAVSRTGRSKLLISSPPAPSCSPLMSRSPSNAASSLRREDSRSRPLTRVRSISNISGSTSRTRSISPHRTSSHASVYSAPDMLNTRSSNQQQSRSQSRGRSSRSNGSGSSRIRSKEGRGTCNDFEDLFYDDNRAVTTTIEFPNTRSEGGFTMNDPKTVERKERINDILNTMSNVDERNEMIRDIFVENKKSLSGRVANDESMRSSSQKQTNVYTDALPPSIVDSTQPSAPPFEENNAPDFLDAHVPFATAVPIDSKVKNTTQVDNQHNVTRNSIFTNLTCGTDEELDEGNIIDSSEYYSGASYRTTTEMDENNQYAKCAGLIFRCGTDIREDFEDCAQDEMVQYSSSNVKRSGSFPSASRQIQIEGGINVEPYDKTHGVRDRKKHTIQDDDELRNVAGHLSNKWKGDLMISALARRVRDFQFAQEKRRSKYGSRQPWGILGLYDHLAAVRIDVEWAEDAAWRRFHKEEYLSWTSFDEKKRSGMNKPFFTYALLIGCTLMMALSFWENQWKIEPFSINPMIGPSAQTLIGMGAKDSNLIVNGGETWRLVTPMILHAGIVHYAFNMVALWVIGSAVEKSHGFAAAAIIFIVSAVGGIILSALYLPEYISVGASGGIFGLTGACIADIALNWTLLFSNSINEGRKKLRHGMVIVMLFFDILLNCVIGLTPFVDNFTHMGGLVFGFLCGLTTMKRLSMDFFGVKQSKKKTCATHFSCSRFFGLMMSVTGIMVTTIILLQGDGETSPCSSCRYLSCAPMPPWKGEFEKWWYCDECDAVDAVAKFNDEQNVYDEVDLDCPNDIAVKIDILEDAFTDMNSIREKLPTYCRQYC